MVQYQETDSHPPDTKQADALEKSKRVPHNAIESQNLTSYEQYINRVRIGFKSTSNYTFYCSGSTKLMLERVDVDEGALYNRCINQLYFDNNVTEVNPPNHSVVIQPLDVSQYSYFVAMFPFLHQAFGLKPDSVQLTSSKDVCTYTVGQKPLPVLFIFSVDKNHSLISSRETDCLGNNLRLTTFRLLTPDDMWPALITSDVTDNRSHLLWREEWRLLKVNKLPERFDFKPKFDETYHVTDKTKS